jgi:hypothetical protein
MLYSIVRTPEAVQPHVVEPTPISEGRGDPAEFNAD